jgi:hypothetical protein
LTNAAPPTNILRYLSKKKRLCRSYRAPKIAAAMKRYWI